MYISSHSLSKVMTQAVVVEVAVILDGPAFFSVAVS